MTLRRLIDMMMTADIGLDDEVFVRILHRDEGKAFTYSEVVPAARVSATGDIIVEASSLKREVG